MASEPVVTRSHECTSREPCRLNGFCGRNLSEMADEIVAQHHSYLRRELPRLKQLLDRAVLESGGRGAELRVLKETFDQFFPEVLMHMDREEQILFPLIHELHLAQTQPGVYGGGLDAVMVQLQHDHTLIDSAMTRFRNLTDNYKPAFGACAPYREFVAALPALEAEFGVHTIKEDRYLFPRARACQTALLNSGDSVQPLLGRSLPLRLGNRGLT